jgi:hypothetical protein
VTTALGASGVLGYNTREFSKNHLGDDTELFRRAHGFQEYWGYLYTWMRWKARASLTLIAIRPHRALLRHGPGAARAPWRGLSLDDLSDTSAGGHLQIVGQN